METTNNTEISKPMIMAYGECRDKIVNSLNESGLPSFILELMIRELLNELSNNTQSEYQTAMVEFQKKMLEKSNTENVTEDKKTSE